MKTTLAFLLISTAGFSADKPSKPLTKAEEKAISKYDDLPKEWKEKAVAAWKEAYVSAKGNGRRRKYLLANDPPYFKPMWDGAVVIYGLKIEKGHWGEMNLPGSGGVFVEHVIDKQRAVCKCVGEFFVLEGIDTSEMADRNVYRIQGVFHVDGTTQKIGGMTLYAIKPIPKKDEEKSGATSKADND